MTNHFSYLPERAPYGIEGARAILHGICDKLRDMGYVKVEARCSFDTDPDMNSFFCVSYQTDTFTTGIHLGGYTTSVQSSWERLLKELAAVKPLNEQRIDQIIRQLGDLVEMCDRTSVDLGDLPAADALAAMAKQIREAMATNLLPTTDHVAAE